MRETAEQIAMYFEEMIGRESQIKTGTPKDGDIYLVIDEESVLGEEGYAMEIQDILTVEAKTEEGILYGGTSISQILSQAEDQKSVPKGMVRDYPQYEVRAVMLDVGRLYIPLEHLEEMTKYAGYFKLSEFRNHINDNGGEQGSAFRVESKVYPQLNEGITAYSQEDYKAYQKEAKKFGVDVVTEIDTPAHAGAFTKIDSSLLMDGYHLDLRTEEAYARSVQVVKDVFDEFLDGEDPVFQNGKFHIGTDEYSKSYSEVVRRYMDEMIRYVNDKGVECRFWASLGTNGFAGETPVSTDAIAHMWSHSWASFEEMKEDGYRFINNADGVLYIVPCAGYNNYLNIKNLYDRWEYSNLNGGRYLAAGHPQLLGAEAALWYDIKVGASEFDIFDRFRDQIILMAEKGWYGEKDDETGEEFISRVEAVDKKTPQANPARYVESAGNLVASYDFETNENGILDLSGNGYDGTLTDTYLKNGALRLNGEGYLSLPFDSIGFPYTTQFDIIIDDVTPANGVIFHGKDGTLYYNYDNTGCLGYERKGYSYLFDYRIPTDVEMELTIVCDSTDAHLYVNGLYAVSGKYYKVTGASKQGSSTFVMPTEKIGSGIYGTMDNLRIYNYDMDENQVAGIGKEESQYQNLALGKPVTVSGVEGGYLENGELKYPQFDPSHATDGDMSTRISLEREDDAWVIVDLEKAYLIEEISLNFGELPNAYAMELSEDGENWTRVEERSGLNGGTDAEEIIALEGIQKARYVKYQQIEQFVYKDTDKYSGNFYELQVYGYEPDSFENTITEAKELLSTIEISEENEEFLKDFEKNIAALEAMMETGPISEMNRIMRLLSNQMEIIKEDKIPSELTDKSELELLLLQEVDVTQFSVEAKLKYEQSYQFAQNVFYSIESDQALVDYACEQLRDSIENPVLGAFVTISTNKSIYQDYVLERLIDGDTSSTTWLNDGQTAGDYILFSFRDTQQMSNIKIYSTDAGSDVIHSGVVEVSSDGEQWTEVGTIGEQAVENLTFEECDVRYVRIRVTETVEYWWKITEVVFDDTLIQDKYNLERELSVEVDASLYTEESYALYEEAYLRASEVYEDANCNQMAIDTAVKELAAARKALEETKNIEVLEQYIRNKKDASQYTKESYQYYETAYTYGQQVLTNEESSQQEIKAAIWKIEDAISILVEEIKIPLEILKQPESGSAALGSEVVVTVEAAGEGLTYQWYYKNPGNVRFYPSQSAFADENVYTIEMYKWRDGQEVYCVITDQYGSSVQTNTVTITKKASELSITEQPKDYTAAEEFEEAVLTVEAEGEGLTYTWYYKNPGNKKFYESAAQFVDGNTYRIAVNRWRNGQQVYCVVTDEAGNTVQSDVAVLRLAE